MTPADGLLSLQELSLHELSLREQQLQFANHLRNPAGFPAPAGLDERRLQLYRRLFFGNLGQLLSTTFPVIRRILPDAIWQALLRDFYARHRCQTPLFPFIAGEFAAYLAEEAPENPAYPFLAELGEYEWAGIALRHHAVEEEKTCQTTDKPRLSPLCWPLAFRWPVHRIGAGYCPSEPPAVPVFLLLCRDAGDAVRFIESDAATFRLLALLADAAWPDLAAVTAQLAVEWQHPDPVALRRSVQETLDQLQQWQVLVINT